MNDAVQPSHASVTLTKSFEQSESISNLHKQNILFLQDLLVQILVDARLCCRENPIGLYRVVFSLHTLLLLVVLASSYKQIAFSSVANHSMEKNLFIASFEQNYSFHQLFFIQNGSIVCGNADSIPPPPLLINHSAKASTSQEELIALKIVFDRFLKKSSDLFTSHMYNYSIDIGMSEKEGATKISPQSSKKNLFDLHFEPIPFLEL